MAQFILNFMLSAAAIKHFPASSGVYLMKDDTGRIIYVGKAINLRKRVSSYFTGSGDSRYQIRFLMNRVAAVDWIVTDTEKEALILENSLIKEHRPRYNLSLRDDKTYFSLRLDPTEKFPRITIIRKVLRDGARYFGPYASATAAREVLKEICRLFPLRHYPLKNCLQRKRPCLYYQLKQCSAPCFGKITPAEYTALVEGAALFLSGRSDEIARIFRKRMMAAAAAGGVRRGRPLPRSAQLDRKNGRETESGLFRRRCRCHRHCLSGGIAAHLHPFHSPRDSSRQQKLSFYLGT